MLLIDIKNYSDLEKLDLVNDYIDFVLKGDSSCGNYDFFVELVKNKRQVGRFLKFTVPYCFENLNYEIILGSLLPEIQNNCEKVAYEYPTFYMLSALVGALHCLDEHLSVKKIIGRGSSILLGIF